MISKDEIIAVADETGLTPNVVEKDYVLGQVGRDEVHQRGAELVRALGAALAGQ